ncbi:hypothetical protein SAMN05192566_1197 [Methylophilus rhizosphaerae]|uniref:Uncharacterized protein n=1 Tax=Methylophilus rhizosphaerae TaxID=492660 RepID=A0A1G9BJ24_9PROT|nr:hypothetical protein SAMN05192566_1197 [Methylophilus rhizosphaerae]
MAAHSMESIGSLVIRGYNARYFNHTLNQGRCLDCLMQ